MDLRILYMVRPLLLVEKINKTVIILKNIYTCFQRLTDLIAIINVLKENWPSEVINPFCVDWLYGAAFYVLIIIHNIWLNAVTLMYSEGIKSLKPFFHTRSDLNMAFFVKGHRKKCHGRFYKQKTVLCLKVIRIEIGSFVCLSNFNFSGIGNIFQSWVGNRVSHIHPYIRWINFSHPTFCISTPSDVK